MPRQRIDTQGTSKVLCVRFAATSMDWISEGASSAGVSKAEKVRRAVEQARTMEYVAELLGKGEGDGTDEITDR